MLKKALSAGAIVFVFAVFSYAQEVGHFDVSLGWGGVFSKTASSKIGNVTIVPTNSGLVLGTFRLRFNHIHGLAVNIGHTNNSLIYVLPPDNYRVRAGITEYTAAYVLNPVRFHKVEPFLFAGAGGLRFNPGNTYVDGFQNTIGARQQTSLAVLYGGGADYLVWRGLAVRLQYRGLVYKEPNFHLAQFFTGVRGHMAEPSIGIVLRF